MEREERSWERNVVEESGVIALGLRGNTDLPHTRVKITPYPAAIGWALFIMGLRPNGGVSNSNDLSQVMIGQLNRFIWGVLHNEFELLCSFHFCQTWSTCI